MRWRDQRGSTTAAFVLAWSVIMLSVAFAADFGRIFVIREQLRTAEDAAALAGALQLDYKVRFVFAREREVSTWVCEEDALPDTEAAPPTLEDCWLRWWAPMADVSVEGWEFKVWPDQLRATWQGLCTGEFRCTPAEEPPTCWIEPIESPAVVEGVARSVFKLNETWGKQATVRSVKVGTAKSHFVGPARPRTYVVLVEGELEMKTYLLAALGLDKVPVRTLESKPRPARAELVRRSKPLEMTLGDHQLTSPCDAS